MTPFISAFCENTFIDKNRVSIRTINLVVFNFN